MPVISMLFWKTVITMTTIWNICMDICIIRSMPMMPGRKRIPIVDSLYTAILMGIPMKLYRFIQIPIPMNITIPIIMCTEG